MGKVFEIVIKDGLKELYRKVKKSKQKSRIMSLILNKEGRFSRREDLAKFLVVKPSTLVEWTKKYKEDGLQVMLTISGGGKRRETVPAPIYKEIEAKLNDSAEPLQEYNDAVLWIKQEFGRDIKYHTIRAFMIRNFGAALTVC